MSSTDDLPRSASLRLSEQLCVADKLQYPFQISLGIRLKSMQPTEFILLEPYDETSTTFRVSVQWHRSYEGVPTFT